MNHGASAGGGGGQGAHRTPLVFPSAVTRGPGPQVCRQTTTPQTTPLLRVNGLAGEGQVWLLSVQGQTPLLSAPRGPFVVDSLRDDHVEIQWQTGNTMQRIECDVPAGGLCVPLLCEAISVDYVRAGTVGAPDVSFAASISSALGSPRAARLTRTIQANPADFGAANRIPPKATEVQFSFDVFAVQATATILIDFLDASGAKVGATGFQNSSPGGVRYTLPRAATQWSPVVLPAPLGPVVAVFEINP